MRSNKQIDCFAVNMKFWKFLAIWPSSDMPVYYKYYYKAFFALFICLYILLFTINFFYVSRNLDVFVDCMLFYFTELAVTSKVLTFILMHGKIVKILNILESDMFQPDTEEGLKIVDKAKEFIKRYWKIVAAVSTTSNVTHVIPPFLIHLFLHTKLDLVVCSYSFLSDNIKQTYIYPLYWYQAVSIHFHMLCNINIDTFILGVIILVIAQLDILDGKLRRVTDKLQAKAVRESREAIAVEAAVIDDASMTKLKECIIHYDELGKFCSLIEDVFSVSLFIQFSMASCIICTCLFRFTLPAPWQYFIFLGTYMFIMIIQIMVPCWFGTRIESKSQLLSLAVYDCDWTSKSRYFKSSLRLFVERANKPLSITAGKMFPLSLTTFTSIMNSAYSFFTLLRHMQYR